VICSFVPLFNCAVSDRAIEPQYTYPGAQVIPDGAQVTEELSFSRTLEGYPFLAERHPPDPAVSPTSMRAHFKCHLKRRFQHHEKTIIEAILNVSFLLLFCNSDFWQPQIMQVESKVIADSQINC
jgi:hypothetical protein